MKLQEQKGRFFVSVPSQFVRLKGWNKGQELVFIATDKGELLLRELKA